jgi:heat shock protein HslJ
MKRTPLALLAVALFFSLTSEKCDKDSGSASSSASTSKPSATTVSMIDTHWNLATLAGDAIRLPEGVENPYINLLEGDRISGFGGCNKLMGTVKMDGSSISFPGLGSSKMFCEKTQALENSFMTALRATNSFKLDGDKLTLLDKSKELATLVKQ